MMSHQGPRPITQLVISAELAADGAIPDNIPDLTGPPCRQHNDHGQIRLWSTTLIAEINLTMRLVEGRESGCG